MKRSFKKERSLPGLSLQTLPFEASSLHNFRHGICVLAILPIEVVQYDANDPENIGWLHYPNIDRIELAQETRIEGFDGDINSRTYYWLDIYCSDGTYLKWWINNCFGDTALIGKTIIAAYNYYWRQNSFFHL